MRNRVMSEYLREPRARLFEKMIEEGTSTQPIQHWAQGLGNLSKALVGAYMAKKLRGEYEDKDSEAANERNLAMDFAIGKPQETQTYGDTTINWNERKPDYMLASQQLSSPYNEGFQNTLFNAQIQSQNNAAQQDFQRQQDALKFDREKQLADMTAQRQLAAQNAMLQRQKELAQWKLENDPINKILMAGQSPTLGQVIPQTQTGSPTQQQQTAPQQPTQSGIDPQTVMFNAALASKGLKAPEGFMFTPNQGGGLDVIRAPIMGQRLTDSQANALGFAERMSAADKIISMPDITKAATDIEQKAKAGIPLVGNALITPEYQRYDQAKRDFINATLRRESGAAISPSEFDSAEKQYFPQPYDTPEVLAQKKRNRETSMRAIARAGGAAGQELANQPSIETGQWGIKRVE